MAGNLNGPLAVVEIPRAASIDCLRPARSLGAVTAIRPQRFAVRQAKMPPPLFPACPWNRSVISCLPRVSLSGIVKETVASDNSSIVPMGAERTLLENAVRWCGEDR